MEDLGFSVALAGYEDIGAIRRLAIDHAPLRRFSRRRLSDGEMKDIRARDLEGIEELLKKENARIYRAADRAGKLAGFIIVMLACEHQMTGEFQAEINDLFVIPEFRRQGVGALLLHKAEQFTRSKGLKYVSVEAISENIPAVSFFQKHGFVEEIKILMMDSVTPREGSFGDYSVRLAKTFDFPRIRDLALETVLFSIPPERDIDDEMIRELYMLRMVDNVQSRLSWNTFYLVAETPSGGFAGFILAEREDDFFCNVPQVKVMNIAVKEEYRGKKVAQALFNQLLIHVKEEQIPYMTGVIATANRRSWLFFERIWKALEERKVLAKKLP
ncbi:MAG: GNAT family N-acetyltransferase [Candidatus Eremiobacteraeota bacterium]|nr:GNAT family N-acetyltransferase [Candidatus Eremiobacteraeota bacterium]